MQAILSFHGKVVNCHEFLVFYLFFVYTHTIMDYIIFDLEWNQCPDGKEFENKAIPFEILEIGAVKLDNEFREIDRFSRHICPQVYPSMHFRTEEILTLDWEDLKQASSFPEVFQEFMDWCGTPSHFCTWGPLDLFELQRNLSYYGIENPFPFPLFFYDIQKLFAIHSEEPRIRRSLEYAVNLLQLQEDLPFHDALSDAVYTAMIFQKLSSKQLLRNFSIDYYRTPHNRKEEIYVKFDSYSKFVSKEFASKTEAMRDRKVTSVKCHKCYKSAHRRIRWFASGNHNYFSLSYCEEHGWIKGKIRIRKTSQGTFFCIKTLKFISQEEAELLSQRKDKNSLKH